MTSEPWTAGYYGDESEKGKRLLRALVYSRIGSDDDNGYAHPVEGLSVLIDLTNSKVLKIVDTFNEMSTKSFNYKQELLLKEEGFKLRTNMNPIEVTQPHGVSWNIDGNEVEWQNWKFRINFTTLEGLILQNISFNNRPVCYRASIAEMVVPYGSPEDLHCFKNVFDAGEYGLGKLANSLELGYDCVGEIKYFDGVMTTLDGSPHIIKNAICLHEEDNSILLKHTDWRLNEVYIKRNRKLIISFIATGNPLNTSFKILVGNYEYGFYWNLGLDGTISLEVKHTGIINLSGLKKNEKKINTEQFYMTD